MMRFLRTNVGSRSRGRLGRSRSSPLFLRKKSSSNARTVIETTQQEPSSPKVTCIGQVRVKRSSSSSSKHPRRRKRPPAKRRHCWCLRKVLSCNGGGFACCKLDKPRWSRPDWRKWVLFFRFGYCKKVEVRDDSSKMESTQSVKYKETDTEEDDEDEEVKVNSGVLIARSPPKNALMLTRCRSAPYRSSSLANLFWGSVLLTTTTETGDEQKEQEGPTSDGRDSRMDGKSEDNLGISRVFFGDSIDGGVESSVVGPLRLTRCKSEPARTGEGVLFPEDNFRGHTRFEYCKQVETRNDPSRMVSNQSDKYRESDTEDDNDEAESELKVDSETESEVKANSEAESEVKENSEAESEVKTNSEAESEVKTNSEAESEVKENSEAESEVKTNSEAESEVKTNSGVLITPPPPKSALVLRRCKSAPYRFSFLRNLFRGSLLTTENGNEIYKQEALQQREEREPKRPIMESEPDCRNSTEESRMDCESQGDLGISETLEVSVDGRTKETNIFESSVGPLPLARCKSEPASKWEALNPEDNFQGHRKLELA